MHDDRSNVTKTDGQATVPLLSPPAKPRTTHRRSDSSTSPIMNHRVRHPNSRRWHTKQHERMERSTPNTAIPWLPENKGRRTVFTISDAIIRFHNRSVLLILGSAALHFRGQGRTYRDARRGQGRGGRRREGACGFHWGLRGKF